MKAIGIYPGTFDPVHEGHVAFAKAAIDICGLDVVYFVPEHNPRGKMNVTDQQERALAIQTALRGIPGLNIIMLATERFTIHDTLPEIESRFGPAKYTLLIGSDVAMTLEDWPECDRLLKKWNLAVGMRHTDKLEDVEMVFGHIEHSYKLSIHRTFIRTGKSDVSSSLLRN